MATTTNLKTDITTSAVAGFYNDSFFLGSSAYADVRTVSGDTINVPTENGITAGTVIAAGATIADAGEYTPSTTTVALTKYGTADSVTYEDLADVNNGDNLAARIGARIGSSLADAVDGAVFAELATTTNNDGASTAVALRVQDILKSVTELKKANARNAVCFVHPDQALALLIELYGNAATPNAADSSLRTGFVGNIGGAPVFQSNLVSSTNGFVYDPAGLVLGVKNGMSIEEDRNPSNQTVKYVGTVRAKAEIVKADLIREIVTA